MPPSVQRAWVDGSGPNRSPYGAAARCRSARITPGWTTAVRASGSSDTSRFIAREKSSTMPVETALPAHEVPAPRATSGVSVCRATWSASATSSAARGNTTTWGTSR